MYTTPFKSCRVHILLKNTQNTLQKSTIRAKLENLQHVETKQYPPKHPMGKNSKREIKIVSKQKWNTTHLRDSAKAILTGKCVAMNAYIKKKGLYLTP